MLRSARVLLPAYMAVIAAIETIVALVSVPLGVICHAVLLVVLLNHYLIAGERPGRRALPILALVPLLRILSFTIPLRLVPQMYWPAMTGAPLLLAVALAVRLLRLPPSRLLLSPGNVPLQAVIAVNGVPLSVAAFFIYRPKLFIPNVNLKDVLISSLILAIFTGFLEELIFRAMLEPAADEVLGPTGTFASSALFASMYITSLSPAYVLFMGLTGFFFGVCVRRTRSIWGVAGAHSLMAIGMLVIWPAVWR